MLTENFSILKDPTITRSFKYSSEQMSSFQFDVNIKKNFNQEDYNKFWFNLTVSLKNPRIESYQVKEVIKDVFKNNFQTITKSNSLINFLDGMAYFLTNQNTLNNLEVVSLLNGFENNLFLETFNTKQTEYSDLYFKYVSTDRYHNYKNHISKLMEKKDVEGVKRILSYMTGTNSNNCEILKIFYLNDFYNYEIIKNVIYKGNLDINEVGSVEKDKSKRTWAFTHSVFGSETASGKNFFNKFIIDFGKSIKFSSLYTYIEKDIYGRDSYEINKDVIDFMWSSGLPLLEKLNRTNSILKYCKINEDVLSKISKHLFSNKIADMYSHEVYDNFIQNEVFKYSSFDKGSLFNLILDLDKDPNVIKDVKDIKGVINPVILTLNKLLLAYPKIKPSVQPFVSWAKNNKDFSHETFNYLFSTYESEIKSLSLDVLNELPNSIKVELTNKGIDGLDTGFFKRLFNGKSKNKPASEVNELSFTETTKKLLFNDKLLALATDSDVKHYINSIKLNAEQFEAFFDTTAVSKNSHYMLNLLPKFLNKIVENYLSFNALDTQEAKENVLVQLKLLNKKSVDVLNEELTNEKEEIVIQSKVNKKIIGQY